MERRERRVEIFSRMLWERVADSASSPDINRHMRKKRVSRYTSYPHRRRNQRNENIRKSLKILLLPCNFSWCIYERFFFLFPPTLGNQATSLRPKSEKELHRKEKGRRPHGSIRYPLRISRGERERLKHENKQIMCNDYCMMLRCFLCPEIGYPLWSLFFISFILPLASGTQSIHKQMQSHRRFARRENHTGRWVSLATVFLIICKPCDERR